MSCGSKTCTPKQNEFVVPQRWRSFLTVPDIRAALRDTAFLFERHRQRQQLLDLDDRLLDDIGLTRDQAVAAARKPFWK
ncbi:MAG: DUF1127 domain-containing protein [Pseudolabrys sp.]|nr:DUF1127 domain-containing protein [Pseudolabrys sp.]